MWWEDFLLFFSIYFFYIFKILFLNTDAQEIAKRVQKCPVYSSSHFPPWLHRDTRTRTVRMIQCYHFLICVDLCNHYHTQNTELFHPHRRSLFIFILVTLISCSGDFRLGQYKLFLSYKGLFVENISIHPLFNYFQ